MSQAESDPLIEFITLMKLKGRWMESGEIEYEGKLYSYKFQELKRKPKK